MAIATMSRADTLRAFREEVRRTDLRIDTEFQRILRTAQELLEMSDGAIADALLVSRPTVNRWINGKNLPYNAIRKPVFQWIDEQLSAKMKALEGSGRTTYFSSAAKTRE